MIVIPPEIRDWLVNVFSTANTAAAGHLTRVPNVHEPHLDTTMDVDLLTPTQADAIAMLLCLT